MIIKDGSALFVSSPFRLKTLFTKPLKYVIQLATNSNIEHAARYSKGKVLDVSVDGVMFVGLEEWIKDHSTNGAKIHYIEPKFELPIPILDALTKYDNDCVGIKYDIFGAVSSVDEFRAIGSSASKIFCSQQVFNGYVLAGIFPPQKDKVSPIELKKAMLNSSIFNNKWVRLWN